MRTSRRKPAGKSQRDGSAAKRSGKSKGDGSAGKRSGKSKGDGSAGKKSGRSERKSEGKSKGGNRTGTEKPSAVSTTAGDGQPAARDGTRARDLLARPRSTGPRVTLGLGWFLLASASVFNRWSVLALWGLASAVAAVQVGRTWREQPRAASMPAWAPVLGAVGAAGCVGAAGVGTALGGVSLIVLPVLLMIIVTVAGNKPAAASGAAIGLVLAAVPAMAVVLLAREGWEPALFLVVAVSFYDAGYHIAAAESSSRLEGPVTGAIGLLAVTFTASAFEVTPFDRVTAWMAGGVLLLACPLGQMLVSAELPTPESSVPAMRRLDSYLVAAPLMLAAVWVLS